MTHWKKPQGKLLIITVSSQPKVSNYHVAFPKHPSPPVTSKKMAAKVSSSGKNGPVYKRRKQEIKYKIAIT